MKPITTNLFRLSFALANGTFLILAPGLIEPAKAEAGLSLSRGAGISERLEIQQQRIINRGITSYLSPIDAAGRFISESTPPSPGLQVTIFNITPGFSSEPFTQRDYSEANGSELITLSPGTEHETRRFSVLPGSSATPKQNDFHYEIYDSQDNLLESGQFSVAVALSSIPVTTVATGGGFNKGLSHHSSFGFRNGFGKFRGSRRFRRHRFRGHHRFRRGHGFRGGRGFRGRHH